MTITISDLFGTDLLSAILAIFIAAMLAIVIGCIVWSRSQ